MNHKDGKIETIIKSTEAAELKGLNQTNEQVRANSEKNLFKMALDLRLKITNYDAQNKYRLFLVSLIVTSTIIIFTYLNALIQHIVGTSNFVNILKIVSTILGFKYSKQPTTCLADQLIFFICLFLLLAYDVYVIRVIASLQVEIENKLANLEKNEHMKASNPDNDKDDDESGGRLGTRKSIILGNKMLAEDKSEEDSDDDSEEMQEKSLESSLSEEKGLLKDTYLLENIEELIKQDDNRLGIMLLDYKDLEEITIQAYKTGDCQGLLHGIREARGIKHIDYDQLISRVDYKMLSEIDLHRWNFYEFYEVSYFKEEQYFKKEIIELHKKKKGFNTDSESEEEDNDQDGEGKIRLINEEEDKKKDIVAIYNLVPKHD